jgi:hypothetical protein
VGTARGCPLAANAILQALSSAIPCQICRELLLFAALRRICECCMAGWARLILTTGLLLKMLGEGDCRLEEALVTTVPPHTFRVVATYRCGGVLCWQRWAETGGKIIGMSRACERGGSGDTATDKIIVP